MVRGVTAYGIPMAVRMLYLFFLAVCSTGAAAVPSFPDNLPAGQLATGIIDHMSDEELLGQVFFLGYIGKRPSDDIKQWITHRNLGGLKIFSRNLDDLTSLSKDIYDLQLLATGRRFGIPLFVSTDQEGGWVRHIFGEVITVPGNLALGASPLPADSFETGYYIGIELALLGINMNFAPTVDVYSNPDNTAIGPRSFSSDPVTAGLDALAYYRGMKKAGIICTAKHFPGHGAALEDSHGCLPEINISEKQLWERELVPYRFLIREGIPAIMTGHIAYPEITGKHIPATTSRFLLKTLLRERLGFTGIVVTDDLEMYGARRGGENIPDAAKNAFLAGCDMILISHTPKVQERVWNSLLHFVKNDGSFKARIKEAVRRVLACKTAAFKGDHPFPVFPDYEHAVEKIIRIQETESKEAVFQHVCRSVTIIRDAKVPYKPRKNEKIVLVSQYSDFIKAGRRRFPEAAAYEYSYYPSVTPKRNDCVSIGKLVRSSDTVIFHLVNPSSLEILKSLRQFGKSVIVVSSLTPVYLREAPWVETAIAVYGTGEDSFKAGFAVLAGDYTPEGRLPVELK